MYQVISPKNQVSSSKSNLNETFGTARKIRIHQILRDQEGRSTSEIRMEGTKKYVQQQQSQNRQSFQNELSVLPSSGYLVTKKQQLLPSQQRQQSPNFKKYSQSFVKYNLEQKSQKVDQPRESVSPPSFFLHKIKTSDSKMSIESTKYSKSPTSNLKNKQISSPPSQLNIQNDSSYFQKNQNDQKISMTESKPLITGSPIQPNSYDDYFAQIKSKRPESNKSPSSKQLQNSFQQQQNSPQLLPQKLSKIFGKQSSQSTLNQKHLVINTSQIINNSLPLRSSSPMAQSTNFYTHKTRNQNKNQQQNDHFLDNNNNKTQVQQDNYFKRQQNPQIEESPRLHLISQKSDLINQCQPSFLEQKPIRHHPSFNNKQFPSNDLSFNSLNTSTGQLNSSSSSLNLGQIKNYQESLRQIKEATEILSVSNKSKVKNQPSTDRSSQSLLDQKGKLAGGTRQITPKIKYPQLQSLLKTKAGQYSSHIKKQNQDSALLQLNLFGDVSCHLFGVYDGHGENGAEVSNFIKKAILKNVTKEIQLQGGLKNENLDIIACLRKAYQDSNKELLAQNIFDIKLSGCTAVTVLIYQMEVYCANTGDSRAIISKINSEKQWSQIELSKDHKPEVPEEMARINANGGRVEQVINEYGEGVGIYRVWKKHQSLPGLAMSRSMGDTMGRECGVIAEPDIIKHTLSEEDKVLVVASDGVWEFLANSEVSKIITPFFHEGKIKEATEKIINQSHKEWLKEGESVDDITCLTVFFNSIKEIQS